MNTELKTTTFVAFALTFALSIWGRSLREKAFRELSGSDQARVADKIRNYTATETIPFAGLLLGLVAVLLFRLAWLRLAYAIVLALLVLLVSVIHVRTRRRFRGLALPASFLAQYERSRIVSYAAFGVPLATMAWLVYR